MATARFFVDADLAVGQRLRLPDATSHHAARVLRLRDGDEVVLFNGRGGEFDASLTGRAAEADVTAFNPIERESPLHLTLIQAWIATDKLDWVVEKAVELGVARIVLSPARRSVTRPDATRLARRLERLREIAVAACCQSGRNRVPSIEATTSLVQALSASRESDTQAFVLRPDAAAGLVALAAATQRVAVAIGPEGGFDDEELALAERSGFRPAQLGPRVLRTETAGIAALSTLQGAAGDFR